MPFCRLAPGLTETSSWASLSAARCWRSQPGGSSPPGPTLAAPGRWASSPGWLPSGPSTPRLPRFSGASNKYLNGMILMSLNEKACSRAEFWHMTHRSVLWFQVVLQTGLGLVGFPTVRAIQQHLLQLGLLLPTLLHVVHVAHDAGEGSGTALKRQEKICFTSSFLF